MKNKKILSEKQERLETYYGTVSLPFAAG